MKIALGGVRHGVQFPHYDWRARVCDIQWQTLCIHRGPGGGEGDPWLLPKSCVFFFFAGCDLTNDLLEQKKHTGIT